MKTESKRERKGKEGKEYTAGEITAFALKHFTDKGYCVWRQNNHSTRGRAFTGMKGLPDIIGFATETIEGRFQILNMGFKVDKAVFLGCETKKRGDTFKPEQRKFLQALKEAGGLSYFACQVGSEIKVLEY